MSAPLEVENTATNPNKQTHNISLFFINLPIVSGKSIQRKRRDRFKFKDLSTTESEF
jgi:hypothetical protein